MRKIREVCTMMGKALFLLAIFLPVTAHSQDIYKDMVVDGKKWNYVKWPYGRSHVELFRGDTIVNGRQCVKFGTTNANDDFYCLCAMYQEGGKVYSIWPGREQPLLEYDFSANVGDTVKWEGKRLYEVASKDIVNAYGRGLRRLVLNDVTPPAGPWEPPRNYQIRWVEGVGSSGGPLASDPDGLGDYRFFVSCTLGGETIYDCQILASGDYDLNLLSYEPEWDYECMVWDADRGEWKKGVSCHAVKGGYEFVSTYWRIYASIKTEETGESTLLLSLSDKWYAKRDSYMEYVRSILPEGSVIFEEPARWEDEVVLFDFSLNEGDRYPCVGDVTVSSVSSLTTRDGVCRRLLHLSNGLIILEGVGCLNSRYGPFAYQNDPGVDAPYGDGDSSACSVLSFRKYGSGTAPIFVKGDLELGVSEITGGVENDGSVYDLQGRKLPNKPDNGIYIQNGQKRVAK